MRHHLRLARPVSDLPRSIEMYCRGLGLHLLGSFDNHAGFDGAMLGHPGASYHFEFTSSRRGAVKPSPTPEDLAAFYVPVHADWTAACDSMRKAGFASVPPHNPYWLANGCTFEDPDGYRVVLQNSSWPARSA